MNFTSHSFEKKNETKREINSYFSEHEQLIFINIRLIINLIKKLN